MNLLRPRRLACLVAFMAASGAAVAEGPFAIRSPQVMVPDEAAGSGLSPEVAVRLSIDERGRVSAVEVRSITPASDFDGFFRDEVTATLFDWRFAPATQGGKPVASTLDWRVRFPVKAAVAESSHVFAPMPGANFEERRAAILALPLTMRRGMLEAEGRAALEYLDSQKKTEAATPRFIVRTDADDPRVAGVIAGNLEAIFNVLAAELLPGVELQAEPYKLLVFVYRSRSEYQAFVANYPWGDGSAGYYSGTGVIAFSLEQPSNDEVMNILLHEATHAFLDRHILRPGVALPRWLDTTFALFSVALAVLVAIAIEREVSRPALGEQRLVRRDGGRDPSDLELAQRAQHPCRRPGAVGCPHDELPDEVVVVLRDRVAFVVPAVPADAGTARDAQARDRAG